MAETGGPVQVRFLDDIKGLTYGRDGIKRGAVVEVSSQAEAQRLYVAGLAQPVSFKTLGKAYARQG
jgi:hypothetical protein